MGRQRASQSGARTRRGRAPNRRCCTHPPSFMEEPPRTPASPSGRTGGTPSVKEARRFATPATVPRWQNRRYARKLRNNPAGQICPPPPRQCESNGGASLFPQRRVNAYDADANPPKHAFTGPYHNAKARPRGDGGRSASHGLGRMPRHNSMWSPKGSWFTRGHRHARRDAPHSYQPIGGMP